MVDLLGVCRWRGRVSQADDLGLELVYPCLELGTTLSQRLALACTFVQLLCRVRRGGQLSFRFLSAEYGCGISFPPAVSSLQLYFNASVLTSFLVSLSAAYCSLLRCKLWRPPRSSRLLKRWFAVRRGWLRFLRRPRDGVVRSPTNSSRAGFKTFALLLGAQSQIHTPADQQLAQLLQCRGVCRQLGR